MQKQKKIPEKLIESAVTRFAEFLGWRSYKFTSPACRSVPDRLFIKRGITIYVEFKATGEKPTPQQLERHAEMRQAGACVFVIDSLDEGYGLFKKLDGVLLVGVVPSPELFNA